MGELDFITEAYGIQIRVNALVMEKLHVPCFGGTTFHRDVEGSVDQQISIVVTF